MGAARDHGQQHRSHLHLYRRDRAGPRRPGFQAPHPGQHPGRPSRRSEGRCGGGGVPGFAGIGADHRHQPAGGWRLVGRRHAIEAVVAIQLAETRARVFNSRDLGIGLVRRHTGPTGGVKTMAAKKASKKRGKKKAAKSRKARVKTKSKMTRKKVAKKAARRRAAPKRKATKKKTAKKVAKRAAPKKKAAKKAMARKPAAPKPVARPVMAAPSAAPAPAAPPVVTPGSSESSLFGGGMSGGGSGNDHL